MEKYIKDCLDSVVNQTWFKTHNDWEIIVGVDCCEKTLSQLKTIMHNYKNLRVFMMDSNNGTYITSNTIMSNATYENIFRFDGDDIMCPNLVEKIMTMKYSVAILAGGKSIRNQSKMFGGQALQTEPLKWRAKCYRFQLGRNRFIVKERTLIEGQI